MLKFQDGYTPIITTFKDFILFVYTITNNLYEQFVPVAIFSNRQNALSDRLWKDTWFQYISCFY